MRLNIKMNKIVSIIVPTYNIEDYLDICLKSFEIKELLEKVEIIIVNDGSTDNSLSIAKKYENKHPNSYIVVDKENGGHGSTINSGIKIARGNYLMIVDGDDWIEPDNLLYICSFLEIYDNYDAVFFDYIMELKYKEKRKRKSLKSIFDIGEIDINKAKIGIYKQIGLANTLYRTSNLKKINLKLLEKTFYVDAEYMLYPMNTIKKAYYFNLPIYHYLIGRPAQSTNIETALKRIDDRVRVIKSIISFFNNKTDFNNFALNCYYSKTSSIINDYYELLIKGVKNFDDKMKEFDKYILFKDNILYNFLSNNYWYIKMGRKSNYNKKLIKICYIFNKIFICLKKR